jgi:hypothetical protein
MTDDIQTLLVQVRAGTGGFDRDIAAMRALVDGELTPSLTRAGEALEKGLSRAVRSGSLGFDDLRRVALSALDTIAAQAARTLVSASGIDVSGLVTGLLGLPGRATGGNVSPGRGYMVGERGPELFVPTSAGRIEPSAAPAREVRVAINLTTPRGSDTPQSLQRSTRQVASAVRRAVAG